MPVPPKLKLNLRFTEALRDRAQAIADREGVSLNTVIVRAIENYLPFRERVLDQQDRAQLREAGRPLRLVEGASLPARVGHGAPMSAAEHVLREATRPVPKVGANQRCPCGSGEKFKRCHGRRA